MPYRESTFVLEQHIKLGRKKKLNTIKIVARKKWGADRKTLRKLYSVICRSKIHYGCQLYSTATPGRLKKLIACAEKASGYTLEPLEHNQQIHSTLKQMNFPSLEIRRNELGLRFIFKHIQSHWLPQMRERILTLKRIKRQQECTSEFQNNKQKEIKKTTNAMATKQQNLLLRRRTRT